MNADDDFVHVWVPGRSDRTLLLLHGTGGTENDLLPLARALDPNASLLSPRGKVLENGMPRFFRRLAEGVFDEEDLVRRTGELAAFVRKASAQYRFDRLYAVGFSNGANIAGALLLLHPGTLAGAALLRPMVPLVPEHRPDLRSTPALIAAGRHDPIAPPDETEALASLLRTCGADVTVALDDGSHSLTQETVLNARTWLAARHAGSSSDMSQD
jgi:predicted esterase